MGCGQAFQCTNQCKFRCTDYFFKQCLLECKIMLGIVDNNVHSQEQITSDGLVLRGKSHIRLFVLIYVIEHGHDSMKTHNACH